MHVDDETRLQFFGDLLNQSSAPNVGSLTEFQRRLLRMLIAQVADQVIDKNTNLQAAAGLLWSHPQVRNELVDLFRMLSERVDHVHHPLDVPADVPLQVHGRYTRIEILAAFGIKNEAKVGAWQTGVYWAKDAKADLFAFTLDKTSGNFSPTTRYRDYAISRELIHWESQSATREASATGKRYKSHVKVGSHIMLFARLKQSERAFWFLGPGTYVKHEGERPMAVEWRLHHPLPGDLYAAFAAAVA